MKTVIIILAEGFEEIEAITPIDLLRRAKINVIVAGLNSKIVTGARGIKIETNILLKNFNEDVDAIILPGGLNGAINLSKSDIVNDLVLKFNNEKKLIAAICASPAIVLAPINILNGKKATCYPGFEKHFNDKIIFTDEKVVKDENIITSRGPGTAFEFSLKIIETLLNENIKNTIKESTIYKM